jgi:diguanylate cyclase (GGDEF)-like protein/PAS domain S-box-containing protein
MKPILTQLSLRGLFGFVLLSAAGVAMLGIGWKFGIEEWIDPYLPGEHATDSFAERWEFVVMASLFSALALVLPAFAVYRLLGERLAGNRLASAVFNAAPQAMVVTDSQRKVIAANPAFEKLSGYQAAEVVGQAISMLKSDLQDDEFYRELGRMLEESGNWSGEVRNRRRDGSVYVVWLSITATCNPDGRVGEYVGLLTDITWRKEREEAALHQAMHDPLTGLANRRLLTERLEQVTSSTLVSGETVGLLFIDLDGFKQVNDTLGHAAGDEVLKTAATRLAACARGGDIVARLAGDEFVILLRDVVKPAAAEIVARRCIASIAEPIFVDGVSVRVGASIGVALSSHRIESADALLQAADRAMYEVKRQGRGAFLMSDGYTKSAP